MLAGENRKGIHAPMYDYAYATIGASVECMLNPSILMSKLWVNSAAGSGAAQQKNLRLFAGENHDR